VEELGRNWTVEFSANSRKQRRRLPLPIQQALKALAFDLEVFGPEAKNWPNFSRLSHKGEYYHCHLNKQKPRYVAVWRVEAARIKFIGVRYVGTHEGVNYKKID
jgi:hypothetical protein